MKRRLVAIGAALVAAAVGAVGAGPACVGTQCDYGVDVYGDKPGEEGHMIGPDTWESHSMNGEPWAQLVAGHALVFRPKPLYGRGYLQVTPYLATDAVPNRSTINCGPTAPAPYDKDTCSNFIIGSGSLAEITIIGDEIWVTNATCAPYYARLVVTAYPAAAEAGAADATAIVDGAAPDAGDAAAADASGDAANDGGID